MALLLPASPTFVNSKFVGNDIYTRVEGDKSHFCPGEEPRDAHE